MNDILMISHFCSDFDEDGNNRFNYLAKLLVEYGYNIEFLTSDFSHSKKRKRNTKLGMISCKTTYITEPLYSKNVSFRRFYSHYVMGKNLKSYLQKRNKPSIIYCAVPSLAVAKIASDYAKQNDIRLVLDIQDLWPEAFKMVFKVPRVSDFIFYPMKLQADTIYKNADIIIGVSDSYVERALKVNKRCQTGKSIYLGTELNTFDQFSEQKVTKPANEIWLAYIGTLGHSYDINMVIDALRILKEKGIDNIKFQVIGDGPLKNKFEDYAKKQNVSVQFTGRLEYQKMVTLLTSCDVAINPIKSKSAATIINKVGDYAAAGIPVINTQECPEYRKLIEAYNAGYNCVNGDAMDVAEKLFILSENSQLRKEMGRNNRRLAEDKFDRKKTYQEIASMLQ